MILPLGFFFCTLCQGNVAAKNSSSSLLLLFHLVLARLFSSLRVRNLQDLVSVRVEARFSLSFCSKSFLCRAMWWHLFPKNYIFSF